MPAQIAKSPRPAAPRRFPAATLALAAASAAAVAAGLAFALVAAADQRAETRPVAAPVGLAFADARPGALYAAGPDGAGSPICVAESARRQGAVVSEGVRQARLDENVAALGAFLVEAGGKPGAVAPEIAYFTDTLRPEARDALGDSCAARAEQARAEGASVCLVASVLRDFATDRVIAVRFDPRAVVEGGLSAVEACPVHGAMGVSWPVERRLIVAAAA